jgi:co-chaperonin GroES (HSP10)
MIKPLRDLICVRPIKRSLSDIIHVENREAFNDGEVLAVGPEVYEIKAGDRIRYGNGDYLSWDIIDLGDEQLQVISEADVAIIVEAA